MIVVTGAAGLIGANIVKALNARGESDILAVDNLTRAEKMPNLADCDIADYLDKQDFIERARQDRLPSGISAVLHQGACSDTMEQDGRYMMENNYRYSLDLLEWCQRRKAPYLYASSASVYGGGRVFKEAREHERPLNVYGYSKFLFDQVVRRRMGSFAAQVAGFRYFNVYGPGESHKGRMASVAFHFYNQYLASGRVRLFEGSGGYGHGEQVRDFVSVEDVVKVNLFFLDNPRVSGIFNVGTGRGQTFNDVACATVNAVRRRRGEAVLTLAQLRDTGVLEYTPFPEALVGKYQSFTQADVSALRAAGYREPFLSVGDGVARYVEYRLTKEAGR